jgi:predicted secreted Zn-dependent protease
VRFLPLVLAATLVVACGSTDENERDGTGGSPASGGSAQNGGTAPNGGTNAGTAGKGGSQSGGAPAGGAGGSSTTGGSAGTGASGGASCDDPAATADMSHGTVASSVETYTVTGDTADEIRASIDANRGRDYDALTTWNITWTFQNCASPTFDVALDVVYDMPEWDEPTSAEPALVSSWDTYMDALYCHEYGHATLGIECANAVYAAFELVQGSSDCDAVQADAQMRFDTVLATYLAEEVEYDLETNHGATMGAVFPPP